MKPLYFLKADNDGDSDIKMKPEVMNSMRFFPVIFVKFRRQVNYFFLPAVSYREKAPQLIL